MSSNVSESGTSEAESGSINANDPEYWNSLEDRDIFFAENKDAPPDFHELREAMLLPRDSPEPDDLKAKNFRAQLTNANNESANLRGTLPVIVPLESMQLEKDNACVKEQLWRRDIDVQPDVQPTLTTPKPHFTIGWKPEVFKSRYKKAYKSIQAFISPVAGYRNVAWLILTIEIGGDRGSMGVVGL